MILLTAAQIGVFVWHAIILTGQGRSIGPNGPPYLGKNVEPRVYHVLIFRPRVHNVFFPFLRRTHIQSAQETRGLALRELHVRPFRLLSHRLQLSHAVAFGSPVGDGS